jgi:hypothetical protein
LEHTGYFSAGEFDLLMGIGAMAVSLFQRFCCVFNASFSVT